MAATRLIAVNASSGAFVAILSTVASRRVYIREDELASSTGLAYQKPDDNFTAIYTVGTVGTPDAPQIVLPDNILSLPGAGRLLGLPVQGLAGAFNARAADTYIKLRSKAGATTVRVFEEE